MRTVRFLLFTFIYLLFNSYLYAQKNKVPEVYSNISSDKKGLYLEVKGSKYYATPIPNSYNPEMFYQNIYGTSKGLKFNFKSSSFQRKMFYGFIPLNDSKHPQPVFFAKYVKINEGEAEVNISEMKGRYDMIGWTKTGYGVLGYRVLDDNNNILYDGKINFNALDFLGSDGKYHEIAYGKKVYHETKPFKVEPSVVEGPLLANLTDKSAVIYFKTNTKFSF